MSRLTEVLARYRKLGIDSQIDYEKLYLYSIITHSTAIEGSTVTEIENQLLFDEGIGTSKPMVEQMMNLDLKSAYERGKQLALSHRDYTPELLCSLSAMVMKNTGSDYSTLSGSFSSSAGELRLINVSAGRGGKSYLAWQKVPDRLARLCDWLNESRKSLVPEDVERIYDLSYEAHYRLVTIHPWADGNGRMSRLVMNMIQYEFGLVPSIVKKENRAEYITALANARDQENVSIFLEFMRDHHIRNIEEQISDYLRSQDDTVNPEDDTVNDTVNLSEKELTILRLLRQNPYHIIREMVEMSGYSRATVNRVLTGLREKGLLRRVGADKNGYWEVVP